MLKRGRPRGVLSVGAEYATTLCSLPVITSSKWLSHKEAISRTHSTNSLTLENVVSCGDLSISSCQE